jgi:hypothetical protein
MMSSWTRLAVGPAGRATLSAGRIAVTAGRRRAMIFAPWDAQEAIVIGARRCGTLARAARALARGRKRSEGLIGTAAGREPAVRRRLRCRRRQPHLTTNQVTDIAVCYGHIARGLSWSTGPFCPRITRRPRDSLNSQGGPQEGRLARRFAYLPQVATHDRSEMTLTALAAPRSSRTGRPSGYLAPP